MATTGFWPVKGRLKEVLIYADNPDKTTSRQFLDEDLAATLRYVENSKKTDLKMYVSGINCSASRAYEEMRAVKQKYHKLGGNVAYHGYQSFKSGEVTPEEAHEIGIKTARAMWGEGYQVLVTTHLNTDNLHNHFVVNSVSFLDGSKYRNKIGQHKELRRISDKLCREYGKSVMENAPFRNTGKGYWAKKAGVVTHREMLYQDLNEALRSTMRLNDFIYYMECLGYRFVRDFGYEHPSVIAPSWERPVRLDTFGKNYTRTAIEEKLKANQRSRSFMPHMPPMRKRTPYLFLILDYRQRNINLVSAVFELITEIIKICTGDNIYNASQRPVSPEMRMEVARLDKMLEECKFIDEHRIETTQELYDCHHNITAQIEAYEAERQRLRNKLRRVKTPEEETRLKEQCKELTKNITPLRRELKVCIRIEERYPKLKEIIELEKDMEMGKFPSQYQQNKHKERGYER